MSCYSTTRPANMLVSSNISQASSGSHHSCSTVKSHLGTGRPNEHFVKPVPPTYVTEYQAAFTDPRVKVVDNGTTKSTAYLNLPSMSQSSVSAISQKPSDSQTSIRSLLDTLERDLDKLESDEKKILVDKKKEGNVASANEKKYLVSNEQSEKKRKELDILGARDAVKHRKLDARIEAVYSKLKTKHELIKNFDPLFQQEEKIISDVDLIRQKLNE